MKSETENESTQEDSTENEVTDETVTKADTDKWRKLILGIDNRKLLEFICTTARARIDIGRADHEATKSDKKDKKGYPVGPYDYNGPAKMKPIFPVEADNIDEQES